MCLQTVKKPLIRQLCVFCTSHIDGSRQIADPEMEMAAETVWGAALE